jgi:hypothetical protein
MKHVFPDIYVTWLIAIGILLIIMVGGAIHFGTTAPASPTTFIECRAWAFAEHDRCRTLQRACHDNLLRSIELCANQFGTDTNE